MNANAIELKLSKARANMDTGKVRSKTRKSLFVHLQELKDELKKVSWTTREELQFSTKVVITAIFIFGFGIYLADFCIKGGLETFKTVVHFIFG